MWPICSLCVCVCVCVKFCVIGQVVWHYLFVLCTGVCVCVCVCQTVCHRTGCVTYLSCLSHRICSVTYRLSLSLVYRCVESCLGHKMCSVTYKLCLSLVYRCLESCLSHRTSCVTYRLYFSLVCRCVESLFESQDKLCDLHYVCPLCTGVWQAIWVTGQAVWLKSYMLTYITHYMFVLCGVESCLSHRTSCVTFWLCLSLVYRCVESWVTGQAVWLASYMLTYITTIQVTCLSPVHRRVASCLSHRTNCVT